jgi:hypothetical protein
MTSPLCTSCGGDFCGRTTEILSENGGDFTKNEGENRRKLRGEGEEVATSSQECSALFATRYLCFAKCRKQKEGWSKKKVQFFSIFYHFGVISSHIYIGTLLNESLRGAALERRRPRPILTLVGWLVIP